MKVPEKGSPKEAPATPDAAIETDHASARFEKARNPADGTVYSSGLPPGAFPGGDLFAET